MSLGPFDVEALQIQNLGPGFTAFVNRLLELEVAAHDLRGSALAVNANDTTPDGGVDAALRGAPGSGWIPPGDSAWQFKRGNLSPKQCADELAGGTWAHAFLEAGGAYVIALGATLTDRLIESRRRAVAEKAIELGLIAGDDRDRVRVYDANQLARWATVFPALAVSRLLGGPGSSAVDYEFWSRSRLHQGAWIADTVRSRSIDAIRAELGASGVVDLRVQGVSGIGKTRLVLEALRAPGFQPLVAYVADERDVDGELIAHLAGEGRTAILVVDDCGPDRHTKLAEKLPADPAIKLLTIGEVGAAATRSPVIPVDVLPPEETEAFLQTNYPLLSPEARRFTVNHTGGNTRWAILFADRLTGADAAQAADLIQRDDIEAFVTTLLPEGRAFFLSAVLALFKRVGWDRELRSQLLTLCEFVSSTPEEFDEVGRELERRGLLTREGRYRAVTPHPLAVFLAAEAWRTEGARILQELLPRLDETVALSLFERVADLGQFAATRSVLPSLLALDGPFGSLTTIEERRNGRLLTQLAIVLPEEVARHLGRLIADASLVELREQTSSRRDLVWTLEKLAWHRITFETAANSLLRLAEAENEAWANNATGTWVDLFGTMLPGTAATPEQRSRYLEGVVQSPDPAQRALSIKALTRMLATMHEAISVSGELQAGVLVEPRGTPQTFEEIAEYRRAAINMLSELTSDTDAEVAEAALTALIDATHSVLDDPLVGDDLFTALTNLPATAEDRIRINAGRLIHMHARSDDADDNRQLVNRLQALLEALPTPSALDSFRLLLELRPWDLDDREMLSQVVGALRELEDRGELELALAQLEQEEVSSSWFVGRALEEIRPEDADLLTWLASIAELNPNAVLGYLAGTVEKGLDSAFDQFLDGPEGRALTDELRVGLSTRGPATAAARARVLSAVERLPVATGASRLWGWREGFEEAEFVTLLRGWGERLESQADYNALVNWLNLRGSDYEIPEPVSELFAHVVLQRREYPEVGRESWDWTQLALRVVRERGPELAHLILDLVDSDAFTLIQHEQEAQVLMQSAAAFPEEVWRDVATRLDAGSWRIQLGLRGWLLHSFPAGVIEDWVDDDVDRARLVAAIAPVGGAEPTPLARFLLARFSDDDQVRGALYGEFMSGTWSGPESGRLASQMDQLRGWLAGDEPEGVRSWAEEVIGSLDDRRTIALEREAEGLY